MQSLWIHFLISVEKRVQTSGFPGLPPAWSEGIDAATYHTKEKKFYLFRGEEFIRVPDGGSAEAPLSLAENWMGWPGEFGKGHLDAVIYNEKQKRFYLFKGPF